MIMTMGSEAFAASSPSVYANKTALSGSEDVKVPVCISDNPGLMGFHFTLKYDPEKVTVTDVTNSSLTSNGLFNQNLNMKKGKFDVVWSGPEAMTEQGPLFYIYLRANDLDSGTSIKLSYVKDDTFDGSLQNVTVKCKPIRIIKGDEDPAKAGQNKDETNPEENFLAREIGEEVTSHLDEKEIITIIHDVAEEEGLDSIKDLTPDQARKILNKAKEKMEAQGLSTEYLDDLIKKAEETDGLDADRILTNAVKGMYKTSADMVENADQSFDVEASNAQHKNIGVIIAILILAAIAACAIILFYRRKKRGTEN